MRKYPDVVFCGVLSQTISSKIYHLGWAEPLPANAFFIKLGTSVVIVCGRYIIRVAGAQEEVKKGVVSM